MSKNPTTHDAVTKLQRHELSAVYKDMPDEEFRALKDSIHANGLQNPITLYEGKILDGWHRHRALMELGEKYDTQEKIDQDYVDLDEFNDKIDPEDYVVAQNVTRRHITATEKFEAAKAILEYQGKTKPTLQAIANYAKISIDTAKRISSGSYGSAGKAKKDKPATVPDTPVVTEEKLRKRITMLEGQLASAKAKLAEIIGESSTSVEPDPEPTPVSAPRRRARK
jgi:hypothetical protein